MTQPIRTFVGIAAATATFFTLSACGSSSPPPDPLATFTTQEIAWTDCYPTFVAEDPRAMLAGLGASASCAYVRVPIDYAHPGAGEIGIAILRVPAGDTSKRRGAILLNPGGPGGDGLGLGVTFGALWRKANPADPVGAMYRELAQRYDLVGFSPRGTGASTQLDCSTADQLSFEANPSMDRSPANVEAILRNARIRADGCRANPLTPFINTDATARDMDVIRGALRDSKISLFGISYGSWLGAWWASLFPERADRVLLSGVMDLTRGYAHMVGLSEMGVQRAWDEVLVPWAAAHPQTYLLGSTPAEVQGVHDALLPETRYALDRTLAKSMGHEAARDSQLRAVLAAKVADAILAQVPPPADELDAQGRVEASVAFVPDDGRRAAVRGFVQGLLSGVYRMFARTTGTNVFSGKDATYDAVVCNDGPWGYDVAGWVAFQDLLAGIAPIAGGTQTGTPCLFWGPPTVSWPPLARASETGPILFTQTELDPLTPLVGARATLAAMPAARMVVEDGGWNHGLMVPIGNPCVDEPVARYLLDGTLPEGKETHCAHPTANASSKLFLDPVGAEALRARIAESVTGRR